MHPLGKTPGGNLNWYTKMVVVTSVVVRHMDTHGVVKTRTLLPICRLWLATQVLRLGVTKQCQCRGYIAFIPLYITCYCNVLSTSASENEQLETPVN